MKLSSLNENEYDGLGDQDTFAAVHHCDTCGRPIDHVDDPDECSSDASGLYCRSCYDEEYQREMARHGWTETNGRMAPLRLRAHEIE